MNSSFSKDHKNLQIAWDATSLELLKTCPRKYQLSILYGFTTAEDNVHLTFGILYHQAHDLFDKHLATGKSHDEATLLVLRYLLEATWNQELSRPWQSDHPSKNRYTLVRSVLWHLDQYRDDPIKTSMVDGRPAVELSFQYQSSYKTSYGEPYILCGHLDRVGELSGRNFIIDYKTTKFDIMGEEFFGYYSPDNQMSLYSFSGKIIYNASIEGAIIDAAQVMVGFTRFRRGFATRTTNQLNEWYDELGRFWLPQAESFANYNSWPMNDTACGRYGGCAFRGICGKDPKVREDWLRAGFKKRLWDPLQVRGDV